MLSELTPDKADSAEPNDSEFQQRAEEQKETATQERRIDQVELRAFLGKASHITNKATHTLLSQHEEITEHCTSLRNKLNLQCELMLEDVRRWNERRKKRVNDYEHELLEKFNEEEFEKESSTMKALINDISQNQSQIEQMNVESDSQQIKMLIKETSAKLHDLKIEQTFVKTKKLGYSQPDLNGKFSFFPIRFNALKNSELTDLEFRYVDTIRLIPDFHRLLNCFINPYAKSYELVAIVLNKTGHQIFYKMNSTGKILKEKPLIVNLDVVRIQTTSSSFILQHSADLSHFSYKRFDYDLNELDTYTVDCVNFQDILFTVNKSFEIHAGGHDIYFFPPGTSTVIRKLSLPYNCYYPYGYNMLANERHLYLWNKDRVTIISLEQQNSTPTELYIQENARKEDAQIKLLGDKCIASFSSQNGTVSLYTQDSKLELVEMFKIKLTGDVKSYKMSTDCSSFLCLFNSIGDIYHNLF